MEIAKDFTFPWQTPVNQSSGPLLSMQLFDDQQKAKPTLVTINARINLAEKIPPQDPMTFINVCGGYKCFLFPVETVKVLPGNKLLFMCFTDV